MTSSAFKPAAASLPAEPPNKIEVRRTPGADGVTLYCGHRLGRQAIPGSDGQCGPQDGSQCADCSCTLQPATAALTAGVAEATRSLQPATAAVTAGAAEATGILQPATGLAVGTAMATRTLQPTAATCTAGAAEATGTLQPATGLGAGTAMAAGNLQQTTAALTAGATEATGVLQPSAGGRRILEEDESAMNPPTLGQRDSLSASRPASLSGRVVTGGSDWGSTSVKAMKLNSKFIFAVLENSQSKNFGPGLGSVASVAASIVRNSDCSKVQDGRLVYNGDLKLPAASALNSAYEFEDGSVRVPLAFFRFARKAAFVPPVLVLLEGESGQLLATNIKHMLRIADVPIDVKKVCATVNSHSLFKVGPIQTELRIELLNMVPIAEARDPEPRRQVFSMKQVQLYGSKVKTRLPLRPLHARNAMRSARGRRRMRRSGKSERRAEHARKTPAKKRSIGRRLPKRSGGARVRSDATVLRPSWFRQQRWRG